MSGRVLPEGWREVTLGESLELLLDHRGKTPTKLGGEFSAIGVPVVSALSVAEGRLDLGGVRFVDSGLFARWMPEPLRRGDVLLTSEAPLGRVALVPSDEPLVLGQRLFGLRGRAGVLDSRFLSHWLQSAAGQSVLKQQATGSTVVGIRQSALRELKIAVPAYGEQRAIAEVLGALDDKIAANSTSRLAALAVGDAVLWGTAKHSPSVPLSSVARFKNKERIPLSARDRDDSPGRVPYYGANGIVGYVDRPIFEEPLVLVGEDGTVETPQGTAVVAYISGPAWVNNHAHVLVGEGIPTGALFFALRQTRVTELVTGAVQPKLSMGSLKRAMVPAREVLAGACGAQLDHLAEHALSTEQENLRLAATRDALLPALMSGRLTVRNAERVVADAT